MKKKTILLNVLLTTLFSCTTQPIQNTVTQTTSSSPTPIASASLPPIENHSSIPLPSPTSTSIPISYLKVWSAISGQTIADGSKTNNPQLNLLKGSKDRFNVIASPDNNEQFSFTSTNSEIVSIDNKGNLTAKNIGKAQIIITSIQNSALSLIIDIIVNSQENIGDVGCACNAPESTFISGGIYDYYGKKVQNAVIVAKSTDTKWTSEPEIAINGFYIIRNIPISNIIELIVSKQGYTSQTFYYSPKSNPLGDPAINIVNFGGPDAQNRAIQNEPIIAKAIVNNEEIVSDGILNSSFNFDNLDLIEGNQTFKNQDNFQIKIEFSETILEVNFERAVRLVSQRLIDSNENVVTIDESKNLSYQWDSNNKSVVITINHKLVTDSKSKKANYLFSFNSLFQDSEGNNAIEGKYFNFKNSGNKDFFVFKVID